MREVVINPYWDVPPIIARNEVVPAIRRRPGYLRDEGFEIVRGGDEGAAIYSPTSENLSRVSSGSLRIRQRPGAANALGKLKFVFPNSHDVYLHGTPAQTLFAESRRDFSHGCIRVEDPRALAEVVLRGQSGWDRGAIDAAVEAGRTRRIAIDRPISVFVLYQTAVVDENDVVHFYGDLYGHDAALSRRLRDRRGAERVARGSAPRAPATD
jgi:L,D-transpeptidase YcbB